MPFKLRPATPVDIPIIIELQTQVWEPTYRDILSQEQIAYMFYETYSADALNRQMTDHEHVFIIAETTTEEDEAIELVGFASYSLVDVAAHTFKLHKIYVHPDTQGTGLGKYLLATIERRCREEGGRQLILNVNRFNKARSFYEKQGFNTLHEEDIPIGPYWMNDYVMGKELA